MDSTVKSIPAPKKLLNRNFILLWQGQFVSQLGTQLMAVTLTFWIKHATGSASLLGIIQMVSTLPTILLGPIGGAYADRYSRRNILLAGETLRGLMLLLLAGFVFMMPTATNAILVWLFVVMIINGAVLAFFSPAISAAIPDLVAEEHINGANSLGQIAFQLSTFLGQGLGGVLYRVIGASTLFFINGLFYFFSAISVLFLHIPQVVKKAGGNWRQRLRAFQQETIDGFHYIWRTPGLREMLMLSALLAFFTTPVVVLLPFYVEDFLEATTDWYGFMLAAYGVGSMIGYLLAGALRVQGRMRVVTVTACIILSSLGYILLGWTRVPQVAVVLAALGGVTGGFVTVNITTIMQLQTPPDLRGRVFGLLGTISGSLTPIAMGLAGVIADLVNQNIPLIYIANGIIMGCLSILMASKSAFREFLSYKVPETETLDDNVKDSLRPQNFV